MTDQASQDGWVVHVISTLVSGGGPTEQFYIAAEADQAAAIEAVKRFINATPDYTVQAVTRLSAEVVLKHRLIYGQVKLDDEP